MPPCTRMPRGGCAMHAYEASAAPGGLILDRADSADHDQGVNWTGVFGKVARLDNGKPSHASDCIARRRRQDAKRIIGFASTMG